MYNVQAKINMAKDRKDKQAKKKNIGRKEEILLNQERIEEIVLGAVMKGDPMRQNLVLVYQIGSERKFRGQPDGSARKDTCDTASHPDFDHWSPWKSGKTADCTQLFSDLYTHTVFRQNKQKLGKEIGRVMGVCVS